MTKELITSFLKKFNFYKQPNRVGDILEYKNTEYLIIGIEKARFIGKKLEIMYTCQNLNLTHELQPKVSNTENKITEFYVDIDTIKHFNDRDFVFSSRTDNLLPIGETFPTEDYYYRWFSYTELEFNFTTLRVSGLAESIFPVSINEARKTLMKHKKKKLDISLIK